MIRGGLMCRIALRLRRASNIDAATGKTASETAKLTTPKQRDKVSSE